MDVLFHFTGYEFGDWMICNSLIVMYVLKMFKLSKVELCDPIKFV